jgi:hypothetical protein
MVANVLSSVFLVIGLVVCRRSSFEFRRGQGGRECRLLLNFEAINLAFVFLVGGETSGLG